jgi:hypothetical protein
MEEFPRIDTARAAAEVKALIDAKKMGLIDYTFVNIEVYPDPNDDGMPELKRFAAMWREFFDYADEVTQDDGKDFPDEVARRYEEELAKVAQAVNSDEAWWTALREKVLPLYRKPEIEADKATREAAELKRQKMEELDAIKHGGVSRMRQEREMLNKLLDAWQTKRWRSISMFYDPVGMDVTTTQMWTNPKTGERFRGDVLRNTGYPQGFVVKIH